MDTCGGTNGNLTCIFGTIKVLSAFWGRKSFTVCPAAASAMKSNNCSLDITTKVEEL
jgi:hypothetical protein